MVQYSLLIGGTSTPPPMSIKYTRYLEPKANTFEIEFPDIHTFSASLNSSVQIYRDGQLAFDGIVEKVEKEFGESGEKLVISGRDVAGYKATSTLFKKFLPLRPIVLSSTFFNTTGSSLYTSIKSAPDFIYVSFAIKAAVPSTGILSSNPPLTWTSINSANISDPDGSIWTYASAYAFSNTLNVISISFTLFNSFTDATGVLTEVYGVDRTLDNLGSVFIASNSAIYNAPISTTVPVPVVISTVATSGSAFITPYNDNLQVQVISSQINHALATNNTINTPVSNFVIGFTGSTGSIPSFLEIVTLAPDRNQFYYPRSSESLGSVIQIDNTQNDGYALSETFTLPNQSRVFVANDLIWAIYPNFASASVNYLTITPGVVNTITKGVLFQNPGNPNIYFFGDGIISAYTDGTYVYFVAVTNNPFNVFYQKFLASRNGLLIPQNAGYSVSSTNLSSEADACQVILDSNGGLWISYTDRTDNSVHIVASSSSDLFLSAITQVYSSTTPQYCSIVPLDNGNIGLSLVVQVTSTNSYRADPAVVLFGGYNASTSTFVSLVSAPDQMIRMDSLSLVRTGVNQFSTMYTTLSGILTCATFNLLSSTLTTSSVYTIPLTSEPPVPYLQVDDSNNLHAFWMNSFSSTINYTFSSNLTSFSTRIFKAGLSPFTFTYNFSMPSHLADNLMTGLSTDKSYIVGAFATKNFSGSEYIFLHPIGSQIKPVFDIGYIPKLSTPFKVVNNTLALFNEQNLSQIFQDIANTGNITIYSTSSLPINQQAFIMRFKVENVSKAFQELQAASGWTVKFLENNNVVFMPKLSLSSTSLTFTRGSNLIDVQYTSDIESLVNRVALVATGTGTTQRPIVLENVSSQTSFGLRESVLTNYSSFDPESTKKYGQQVMFDYSQPRQVIAASVIDNYSGVAYSPGDSIILVDDVSNISSSFTILQIEKEFSPSSGERTKLNLGKISFASSAYSYKPPSLREVFGDIHTLIKESSNYPQNNVTPINISITENLTSGASVSMNFTIDSSYVDIITGVPAISKATLTLVPQNYYNQSTGSYVLSQITSVNVSIQTQISSTITSFSGIGLPTIIDVTNAIKNVDFYTLSITPDYQSTTNTQGRISALLTILAGLNGVSL